MSSCRETARAKTAGRLPLLPRAAPLRAAPPARVSPASAAPATPPEVKAWDIDVRPDFKGLPKGSGSVARKGMDVWEPSAPPATASSARATRCSRRWSAAPPRGRQDRPRGAPDRRLLPRPHDADEGGHGVHAVGLHQPRHALERAQVADASDEVYAVTAYLLNLGGVLPDDFVLSDANIAEVQARMPNRNGMTTDHGLWPGKGMGNGGKPDVKAVACMKQLRR
jgi:S-disulfanyl-L-cysteine oxidoreductase SoxD